VAELEREVRGWENGLGSIVNRDVAEPGAVAVEITRTRERLWRTILAERMREPALAQDDVRKLLVREALENVARQAGERGDWRHAFALLREAEASPSAPGSPGRSSGEVRAFLTGRNLEKAELWKQAAANYKVALKAVEHPALVTAAAERLKWLAANHPESVRETTP
jgi:hypothetical protein